VLGGRGTLTGREQLGDRERGQRWARVRGERAIARGEDLEDRAVAGHEPVARCA